jgi:signal transduction histidine kinase
MPACKNGYDADIFIVGNALKYTISGKVTVKLFTDQATTARSDEPETTNVTLLVEDTGIGMSRDFVSNDVLVPFRQADSHSPGTGLGLSIVKEILKEFKGSLDIHSELGKGLLPNSPSLRSRRTTIWAALSARRPDIFAC